MGLGYETQYAQHSRVYQFLKYHMWTPSCAYVTCPSGMTDGAARLLLVQLRKGNLDKTKQRIFETAHKHLVSRDPANAWTSGQWMTERTGGSDIKDTETQATYSPDDQNAQATEDVDGNTLGPYSISGFKWFSSATDSAMTVLLARETSGGISAFFAPMRRRIGPNSTELNGITIQRLKSKLGTRAVPTAELVLSDMRAWPVGKPGEGVKEISTVLNITRAHNAVTAVGLWSRGLAMSRAFSRVRRTRGRLLMDTPAHVRTLAEQHIGYRAMMHLTYFTVALLGTCENEGSFSVSQSPYPASKLVTPESAPFLLRLMTPLAKMLTAKASIAGLAECMESLGGVGYLENDDVAMNVARLFRDANVLSIWEGTTNIMADDLIRVVKGSTGSAVVAELDKMNTIVSKKWDGSNRHDWSRALAAAWTELRQAIGDKTREELSIGGRDFGKDLGWIICFILLGEDALSDGDDVANEICTRWMTQHAQNHDLSSRSWSEQAKKDRSIVFGDEAGNKARL